MAIFSPALFLLSQVRDANLRRRSSSASHGPPYGASSLIAANVFVSHAVTRAAHVLADVAVGQRGVFGDLAGDGRHQQ